VPLKAARVFGSGRAGTFGAADPLLHRQVFCVPRTLPRAAPRVAVVVTSGSVRSMRVVLFVLRFRTELWPFRG